VVKVCHSGVSRENRSGLSAVISSSLLVRPPWSGCRDSASAWLDVPGL